MARDFRRADGKPVLSFRQEGRTARGIDVSGGKRGYTLTFTSDGKVVRVVNNRTNVELKSDGPTSRAVIDCYRRWRLSGQPEVLMV